MSRSNALKRIHYVRAMYGATNSSTLETALRKAMLALPKVRDTEVTNAELGTLAIRHRDVMSGGGVCLAIGLGVEGESMGTMGLKVAAATDKDSPEPPPAGRAFKIADAFCLVDDDEVLVCNDGGMRIGVLEFYLGQLLAKAGLPTATQPGELRARLNQDKKKTLAIEGVKEIKITSSAFQASKQANVPAKGRIRSGFSKFVNAIADAFAEDIKTDADRDTFARHIGDISVSAVIKVSGGSRGEPVVVKSLQDVAINALNEDADGADVTLVTTKGNPVAAKTLTLSTQMSMKRLKNSNDIDHLDAWRRLVQYRSELFGTGRWKT